MRPSGPIRGQIRHLFGSQFRLQLTGLALLTVVGHGFSVAVSPLLTRMASPTDFGVFGLFYAFTATAGAFLCLFYDLPIPSPEDDEEARDLAAGAMMVGVGLSLMGGLLFLALVHFRAFGFGAFPLWAAGIAALVLLLQVSIQVRQGWAIRQRDPIAIGKGSVTLNVARGLSQVALCFAGGGWIGLTVGEAVGRGANVVHLALRQGQGPRARFRPQMWATLGRYRHFPLVLLPAQLIDAAVSFGAMAALTLLFGPAGLGQYFLMRRTLDLPVAFASRTLTDLIYVRLSEHARDAPERVRPFYLRSFLALLIAGLIAGIPLMMAGPFLFRLVFGDSWAQAGLLAAIMTPAAIMNLAVAPTSRIFAITDAPHLRYAYSVVTLIGTLIVAFVAWRADWDLVATTAGLSAVTVVGYASYLATGYIAAGRVRGAA